MLPYDPKGEAVSAEPHNPNPSPKGEPLDRHAIGKILDSVLCAHSKHVSKTNRYKIVDAVIAQLPAPVEPLEGRSDLVGSTEAVPPLKTKGPTLEQAMEEAADLQQKWLEAEYNVSQLVGMLRAVFYTRLPLERVDDVICRDNNKLYWRICALLGPGAEPALKGEAVSAEPHNPNPKTIAEMSGSEKAEFFSGIAEQYFPTRPAPNPIQGDSK